MSWAPVLADITPPDVLGVAALTTRAFHGATIDSLLDLTARLPNPTARLHDQAVVAMLGFQPAVARRLQNQALARDRVFRVARSSPGRLRVLSVMLPGDLMANTPLDFLLHDEDIRLDLYYHEPGAALPDCLPDHDVAFFAASDSDPAICAELQALFESWPRPVLNPPRFVPGLDRDALSARLAGEPSIDSPLAIRLPRSALSAGLDLTAGPMLARPVGSHAGRDLIRVDHDTSMDAYLATVDAAWFHVTPFVDYRGPDGRFRKYRIAFVEGAPFLCHMAISDHWMVHYLNAGMAEDAAKRAEEARAMADFERDFAARHARAFNVLADAIGLEYFSIDCAELADGRLLLFEADNAAIIHMMDAPNLFAYKQAPMRRAFAAFADLLRRRAGV